MRALRFHAAKDLRLDTIPEPKQPGPGQVLVRNRSSASAAPIFTNIATARSSFPPSRIPLPAPMVRRFSAMNSAAWSRRSATA